MINTMKNKRNNIKNEATADTLDNLVSEKPIAGATSKDAASAKSTLTVDDTKIKEEVTPKTVYNTTKVAELVGQGSSSSTGVSPSLLRGASAISYSGGAGAIGSDRSAIVRGENVTKSGDRPGRQLDRALQHIDDVAAETYSVHIDTIPTISEGQSGVGFNGHYFNEHAISQKGSGGSPADNKFFRTLDEISYDNIYYADGQYNVTSENRIALNLNVGTLNIDQNTGIRSGSTNLYHLGNFIPNNLVVTFNDNGAVQAIDFTMEDITPVNVTETQYRTAGDAFLRSYNLAEADRLAMIEKAGDETQSNWSPLGKVIYQPSDTNRFIKEYDASVGDMLALSYAKLSHALAYQCNKSAKDGLRRVGPMFEMTTGNVDHNTVRMASHNNENINGLWDQDSLANGSSALFIAMKDTVTKYNTKGKLLSLPLTFKTAISTASANIKSFYMHKTFLDEFNRQEVFGKIDEDGSGITPTFLSDGANLALPLNMSEAIGYVTDSDSNTLVARPLFTMYYEDLRNTYTQPFNSFFFEGLVNYFNRHGSKILQAIGDNRTLTIPVTSTTTSISLWDLILCDASKDIAMARKYAMDLIIKYQDANGSYPYSNVIPLSTEELVNRPNIGFTDISTPLTTRNIPLTTGVRILLPETFIPLAYLADDRGGLLSNRHGYVSKTLLPWYFSQNQFTVVEGTGSGSTSYEDSFDNANNMTFFDFRGGNSFGNADRIKAMDPEQLKLCMDRMVTMPNTNKQCTRSEAFTACAYKYSLHDDGIPTINYYAMSEKQDEEEYRLTIRDVLRTPRELGLSMIAPAGVVTPTKQSNAYCGYVQLDSAYLYVSGSSFRLKYWHSAETISHTLFDTSLLNNVAANLSARYDVIYANSFGANTDLGIRLTANNPEGHACYQDVIQPLVIDAGLQGYNYETGIYENAETPISNIEQDNTRLIYANIGVVSYLKPLYTRMQILPFVINPFDTNVFDFNNVTATSNWTRINPADPFDFLHLFNMCGFRAGEYSGISYDRNKSRIQLGLGYVEDPYIQRRL